MTLLLQKKIWGVRYVYLVSFALLSVFFFIFSNIDLRVAAWLFEVRPTLLVGGSFIERFEYLIYHYSPFVGVGLGLGALLFFILTFILKNEKLISRRKKYLFIVLVMVVGPGLVVNALTKWTFGRPRPRHLIEYGGKATFTPAFAISNQCRTNCSFVSGHSAIAFFVITPFLLFRGLRRRLILVLGFLFGCLVGFLRMLTHAHFLSDVVFSFVFIYLSAQIIHHFLFRERGSYATGR